MDTCGLGFKVIIFSWSKTKLSKYSWNESGEEWRSFKGHSVRSSAKDGEHRSQVRRRGRLLLLQVLPMPPPPVDVPTLISMWWLKEPYMMLLLFTTTANKTQVVDMFFVYKKPLASSRQLSCFRQLWYGWWNPRCRWHHHDFCFSTSVLDIYVQKLRMTQLTQSDWPILLQKVDTGQCTSPPLTQSRVIFSISC